MYTNLSAFEQLVAAVRSRATTGMGPLSTSRRLATGAADLTAALRDVLAEVEASETIVGSDGASVSTELIRRAITAHVDPT